jgi:anti-sigma factor RsiW
VSPADDLACDEIVELVTGFLEGAMPPDDRARFEAHLAICDGCQVYVGQMRESIRLCGAVPKESLTPEAEAAFLAAFRGWKAGRTKPG